MNETIVAASPLIAPHCASLSPIADLPAE